MSRFCPPVSFRTFCRPFCPAVSRSALWPLLGVFLAAGCARTQVVDPLPTPAPVAAEPLLLGVAMLEPMSDVADLTEAVRHVVRRGGVVGARALTGGALLPAAAAPPQPAPREPAAGRGATLAAVEAAGSPANDVVDPPAERPTAGGETAAVALPLRDSEAEEFADTPEPPPIGDGYPAASVVLAAVDGPVMPPPEGGTPSSEAPEDAVLTPGTATQDAIRAAWERHCVTADLTPEEWGIIDRTAMPAALEAQWAERCRPEK